MNITRLRGRAISALGLLVLLTACETPPVGPKSPRPVLVTSGACPMPVYPPLARRLELEGSVVLRLNVDLQGVVTQAEVLQSATSHSGPYTDAKQSALAELDRVAVEAFKRCKFEAVTGNYSPARVRLPVHFKLE